MKPLLAILVTLLTVVSADVSHLSTHYLPPSYHMQNPQQHHPNGIQKTFQQNHRPSNERVETTIEKHEVIELPTQIEIVKEGQPIYGVQPQNMEIIKSNEQLPEIRSQYFPPSQEIENLQPPQVPYEMPMKTYLPPVAADSMTTTDMPETTTTVLPPTTTTYSPSMEETTKEVEFTTEENRNNNEMTTTTEIPEQEQQSYDTTTLSPENVTAPENRYLPPMYPTPQNLYLPPSGMMLPPPEPMPQFTYQQYQEQMINEQRMQQMYREQEMHEMMQAIAEMEQQQMIAIEPQEQPVAPVEPSHVLRKDGYHYKTADDNLRRYRYRH